MLISIIANLQNIDAVAPSPPVPQPVFNVLPGGGGPWDGKHRDIEDAVMVRNEFLDYLKTTPLRQAPKRAARKGVRITKASLRFKRNGDLRGGVVEKETSSVPVAAIGVGFGLIMLAALIGSRK